jgi:hypothetical protein
MFNRATTLSHTIKIILTVRSKISGYDLIKYYNLRNLIGPVDTFAYKADVPIVFLVNHVDSSNFKPF